MSMPLAAEAYLNLSFDSFIETTDAQGKKHRQTNITLPAIYTTDESKVEEAQLLKGGAELPNT